MNYLITGAGRGIGLELCLFALEGGHKVYALVRDPHTARALATAKAEYKDQLEIIKVNICNVGELQSVQQTIEAAPIDVLINNAGVFNDNENDFLKLTEEDLINSFAVNSMAPIKLAQIFMPNLQKSKNAKLINITSLMGSIADNTSGGYYAYRMSKAALNMFTKTFSVDCKNITALTLHPGWVKTDMGGAKAPLLPRESARGLFKVITEATIANSGQFLDYQGKKLPW